MQSRIVHSVLLDYLGYASPEESSQMLEQARNHIKALTQSKEGVHVAMMCVWMGNPKVCYYYNHKLRICFTILN